MLTRRRMLSDIGAVSTAIVALRTGAGFAAAPSTVKTAVDFDVPRGSCDCHVHVFDPTRVPYSPNRPFTPPPATVEDLRELLRELRLDRVVIVAPGDNFTNNSFILDAVRQLGPSARAIAVIDKTTARGALEEMAAAGFRGVRLAFEVTGVTDPVLIRAAIDTVVEQIRGLNWHLQVFMRPSIIDQLKDFITQLPVPVVIDHFGRTFAAQGPNQPGFDALVDLVRTGRVYVKISAVNRISERGPDYQDATPIAQALVKANSDRIVWGSDWPHFNGAWARDHTIDTIAPPLLIDDGLVFNQLPKWVPDPTIRKKILVDNPARLYGFEPTAG
jgi:predicted TIM-barrel fold metal-dependent hydrolase